MKNTLLGLLLTLLISCQQNELLEFEARSSAACDVTNPVEELAWLKAMIQTAANPAPNDACSLIAIRQGNYQGQTVYITSIGGALCCPCAGSAIYNCQGELILVCNVKEESKIKNLKTVWERK